MSGMPGLPPELEHLLDEWFRPSANGDWSGPFSPPSDFWAALDRLEPPVGGSPVVLSPRRSPLGTVVPTAVPTATHIETETVTAGSALGSTEDDASDEKSPGSDARSSRTAVGKSSRVNASRQRMKNELQYLRQRALELETLLEGLKSTSTKKQRCEEEGEGVLRSVWRQIAERQLARRRQVENENDRLKGMLAEYVMLARRMEQFLYKRPRPEQLLCDDGSTSSVPKKSRMMASIDVDDEALLLRFVGELDAASELVDTVVGTGSVLLEAQAKGSSLEPILQTKTAIDGRQVTFVELSSTCIIPFAFDRVLKAAWISAKQRFQRQEYVTYAVDNPDDTIAVRFPQEYQGRGFDNIVVIRRYVSNDRLVWVWRALSECDDECKHVLTDETGWSVFQAVPASGDRAGVATAMLSCIHAVPVSRSTYEPAELGPREMSVLSTMLRNTYTNDEAGITSLLEDLLLDDPLGY